MSQQDRFERTVISLSEAALGDSGLLAAAAMINDLTRATGHSIAYGDPGPANAPEVFFARFFEGTERRDDWERAYFGKYWQLDECVFRLHTLADGQFAFTDELYTDEEKKISRVYNEFRRVTKSQNGLFMLLDGSGGSRVAWSFADSAEAGGYSNNQIRMIERLAPYVRQFARVRRVLADAEALGSSLSEMLDNTRSGVIQLDRSGMILAANDRARRLLGTRDGLNDSGGMLHATTRGEDAELQRLLARAVSPYGAPATGGSMKVTRREAPAPLVVEIQPTTGRNMDYRSWEVSAIVLIVDPAAPTRIAPGDAGKILGLSPMESRVAVALASSQSAAQVAEALGCAESTVRTHVKRIYGKLEINKQTDLVRRILSLDGLRAFRD